MSANSTSLAALKTQAAPPEVRAGFDTASGFALMQRGANLLANSTMVPEQYRSVITKKDRYGNIKSQLENPAGLSNCVIALNMAQRMGADPLMIMQNLYIVEGRPAWSSQYIIASINACGKYSPLRFKMEDFGEKEVEYEYIDGWADNRPIKKKEKVKVRNIQCTAWALEKQTGETLESPPVSVELAVKEGWYGKNGSKWKTMPEVMLRYRAASFFGKLYAPELLMGIQTAEEVHDSIIDMEPGPDGGFRQVTSQEIAGSATTTTTAPATGVASESKKEPAGRGAKQNRNNEAISSAAEAAAGSQSGVSAVNSEPELEPAEFGAADDGLSEGPSPFPDDVPLPDDRRALLEGIRAELKRLGQPRDTLPMDLSVIYGGDPGDVDEAEDLKSILNHLKKR